VLQCCLHRPRQRFCRGSLLQQACVGNTRPAHVQTEHRYCSFKTTIPESTLCIPINTVLSCLFLNSSPQYATLHKATAQRKKRHMTRCSQIQSFVKNGMICTVDRFMGRSWRNWSTRVHKNWHQRTHSS
jgi:hypothetical protein